MAGPWSQTAVFRVGAHVGFRGRRWPFGRLTITPAGLHVSTSGRRRIDAGAPRYAINSIKVGKGMWGQRLRVFDTLGVMSRISIEVPFNRATVVATLRAHGYIVTG